MPAYSCISIVAKIIMIDTAAVKATSLLVGTLTKVGCFDPNTSS